LKLQHDHFHGLARAEGAPESGRGARQFRRAVSVQITTSKKQGVLLSAGQPLAVSVDSAWSSERPQRRRRSACGSLNKGTEYHVGRHALGGLAGGLRQAGTGYPSWIAPYLQVPDPVPETVRARARELTRGWTILTTGRLP
jgi:hypothetical protein